MPPSAEQDLSRLQTRVVRRLAEIPASDWDLLVDGDSPFLRHAFLDSLEQTACLEDSSGWYPNHLLFMQPDSQQVIAALPLYLKDNSFGEFVFDWSWADAYHQAGQSYYPKLVAASPFTPANGPRVLLHPDCRNDATLSHSVLETAIQFADSNRISSLHLLFTTDPEPSPDLGLMWRYGCQFHWHNRDYQDFDDFLASLNSRRRKQIRKERRDVRNAGIHFRRLNGNHATDKDWLVFHEMYLHTFEKHGNHPALTLAFFQRLARNMPDNVLLVQAMRENEVIASSFSLVGSNSLYGRYWGSREQISGLHFETCYYQCLEFCIENGLELFEPGAQGEHKISRGFLPTTTRSLHWIRDQRFRQAIERFLRREKKQIGLYMQDLNQHSPYRQSP